MTAQSSGDQVAKGAAPYQPNKRTIGELLSMTSPPIVVPDWQRSYSWTLSHVETFWKDLLDFELRNPPDSAGQYFLGSVVIVETSNNQHLLLDGQQRLATSAILLSVIRDYSKIYKEDAALRIQARYLADFDDAKNETVYKLTLNAYDREFFRRKILEYRDGSYSEPEPEYASHNLISSARSYFEEVFQNQYADFHGEEAFQWSLRIQDVLMSHFTVIAVTSTDEDSAAEVFETLNDRGIGLSTPDLLRNFVMRRAKPPVRDDIVELWGDVLEFDTDGEIKTFLRHFWISHQGDVKTQGLYREIKSHLLDNNIDSLEFSRSLNESASIYRDIKAAHDDDQDVETILQDIASLGAGANILYPVILSIVHSVEPDKRAQTIQALLNLYIRHSVISQLENSRLENVIYKVATDLRGENSLQQCIVDMANFAPSNENVIAAFKNLSVTHNGVRRYLLLKLEENRHTTGELGVNSSSRVHVEHIYPQTPKEGEKLENHTQILNRLGNLTLLGSRLNMAIRNGTFDEKKPAYEHSEIQLTRELCNYDNWGADIIEERQETLANEVPDIWPILGAEFFNFSG